MQYSIIFGKIFLITLSPHNINSDSHFAQSMLSLGCQKNIKLGSPRAKYLRTTLRAHWPPTPTSSSSFFLSFLFLPYSKRDLSFLIRD